MTRDSVCLEGIFHFGKERSTSISFPTPLSIFPSRSIPTSLSLHLTFSSSSVVHFTMGKRKHRKPGNANYKMRPGQRQRQAMRLAQQNTPAGESSGFLAQTQEPPHERSQDQHDRNSKPPRLETQLSAGETTTNGISQQG